nr:TRAP transporter large permease [Nitratireductor pacificus]
MPNEIYGLLGIVGLAVLLILRVPVALAIGMVGFVGIAALSGVNTAFYMASSEAFATVTQYELVVIPLFVLMGNIASASGLSRDLYDAAFAWIGRLRGGLASATVIGCAGFSALSGSSIASAVTMGRVALPQMKRFSYSDALATGSVAAGGTLGILIPPSTGFIIYATLTEQSIGRLFMAGILPGILLTALFVVAIYIVTSIRPADGPAGEPFTLRESIRAGLRASLIGGIIVITIGGIYLGFFTPAEAAGIGAILTLFVSFFRGRLSLAQWKDVLMQTVRTTSMVFLILVGANIFAPFLALSDLPHFISQGLTALDVGPYGVLFLILAAYIILGTFLEGLSLLVITLPIVFPAIIAAGFDPIWFGVIAVIVLEMGLISPPVGLNVFVVASIADKVPLSTVFRGVIPFWIAMAVCTVLLILFPSIALYIPQTMMGN